MTSCIAHGPSTGRYAGSATAWRDDLTITLDGVCGERERWVALLRRISAAKLRSWGLEALVSDAELLVSELVTNAVKHGADHDIVFRLVIALDTLLIEVDDGSPRRPMVRVASPDEESGRGMFLVEAIADAWGVGEGGTSVWCTLSARRDASA